MNKFMIAISFLAAVLFFYDCGHRRGAVDVTTKKIQCRVVKPDWITGHWECVKVTKITTEESVRI